MGKQPNIPIEMPAENVVSDFSGSAPSSDQQVRKYFPETFIWMDGQSGQVLADYSITSAYNTLWLFSIVNELLFVSLQVVEYIQHIWYTYLKSHSSCSQSGFYFWSEDKTSRLHYIMGDSSHSGQSVQWVTRPWCHSGISLHCTDHTRWGM